MADIGKSSMILDLRELPGFGICLFHTGFYDGGKASHLSNSMSTGVNLRELRPLEQGLGHGQH